MFPSRRRWTTPTPPADRPTFLRPSNVGLLPWIGCTQLRRFRLQARVRQEHLLKELRTRYVLSAGDGGGREVGRCAFRDAS